MTLLADLAVCLRFFSRLPVPAARGGKDHEDPGLATAAAMVPVAGAIIAIFPCLALLLSIAIGLPAALAAPLAIVTMVAVTGALHEDGLADCADGFGGGQCRERKLAIMRDSRNGTFGVCAIALSLYVRAAALGIVAARAPILACAGLVAAASLSRAASLMPLVLLPPARSDGLGAAAGRPLSSRSVIAAGVAVLVAAIAIPAGASVDIVASATAVAAIAALAVCSLAWRQIGGQTGDVAGAAQQFAEVGVLLTFAAS